MNVLSELIWSNKCDKKPAFLSEGDVLTYGEMWESVIQELKSMDKAGVSLGAVVCLLGENSVDFLVALVASIERNCRIIILQPKIHGNSLQQTLNRISPEYVWYQNDWRASGFSRISLIAGAEPGVFFLTTGTEGTPKIVPRTYEQLKQEYKLFTSNYHWNRWDTWTNLPLGHAFAFGCAFLATLGKGATLFLSKKFLPNDVAKEYNKYQPQMIITVPYIIQLLVTKPQEISSSIGLLLISGGSISPALVERFNNIYRTPISIQYGSSETGPVTVNYGSIFGYDSVGIPYPGVQVKINSDGFILIKSPAMTEGYVEAGLNNTFFENGWFLPGDNGRLSEQCDLKLTGRSKIFNIGGFKVSGKEVESVLQQHPNIVGCKVNASSTGFSDHLIAYVVTSSIVTKYELKDYCSRYLEKFKIPSEIVFVDKLPTQQTWKTNGFT